MQKPRTLILTIAATATAFGLVLGSIIFDASTGPPAASTANVAQGQQLAQAPSLLRQAPRDR